MRLKAFIISLLLLACSGSSPAQSICQNGLNVSSNDWCLVWPATQRDGNDSSPIYNGYSKLVFNPADDYFYIYLTGTDTIVTLSDTWFRYKPYVGTHVSFDTSGNITCNTGVVNNTNKCGATYPLIWEAESWAGDHNDNAGFKGCPSGLCNNDTSGIVAFVRGNGNGATNGISSRDTTIQFQPSPTLLKWSGGSGNCSGSQFMPPRNFIPSGNFPTGNPYAYIGEHARIWIEDEEIDYTAATWSGGCTGTSDITLTGVTRGVNGTTTHLHSFGSLVTGAAPAPSGAMSWVQGQSWAPPTSGVTVNDHPPSGHPYMQYAFDTKRKAIWLVGNGGENVAVPQTWYHCVDSSVAGGGYANCSSSSAAGSWTEMPGSNYDCSAETSTTPCTVLLQSKVGAAVYDAADDAVLYFGGETAGASNNELHILCPDGQAHSSLGCPTPPGGAGTAPEWQLCFNAAPNCNTGSTNPPRSSAEKLLYIPDDGHGNTAGYVLLFQGPLKETSSTACPGPTLTGTPPNQAYIWSSAAIGGVGGCSLYDIHATQGINIWLYTPSSKNWKLLTNSTSATYVIGATTYTAGPAPQWAPLAAWDTTRKKLTVYEGPIPSGQTALIWGQYQVGLYTADINASTGTIAWSMSNQGLATNRANQPAPEGTAAPPACVLPGGGEFGCDNQKSSFEYDSTDDIYVMVRKVTSTNGLELWQLSGSALGRQR